MFDYLTYALEAKRQEKKFYNLNKDQSYFRTIYEALSREMSSWHQEIIPLIDGSNVKKKRE